MWFPSSLLTTRLSTLSASTHITTLLSLTYDVSFQPIETGCPHEHPVATATTAPVARQCIHQRPLNPTRRKLASLASIAPISMTADECHPADSDIIDTHAGNDNRRDFSNVVTAYQGPHRALPSAAILMRRASTGTGHGARSACVLLVPHEAYIRPTPFL